MAWIDAGVVLAASLAGLAGVGLSAAAAHGPAGPSLDTAARFLLVHAAALTGLAALIATGTVSPRLGRAAAIVLILGLSLFCGDLIRRSFAGAALFPMAAPAGGILLMAGWGLAGLSALVAAWR
jgi:uncharacterized membrane protein YgdD (TMEM256/DUF423 family)